MSKLIVVIVNWNTLDLTSDCLNTLLPALEGLDNEIWIVDNASSDNSVEMLKTEFPQTNLIENRENVGFARANNQILREVSGDYYLLLNTDTLVPENSIRELCRFLDEHAEAGAVGPRLKNGHGVVEQPLKRLPTLGGELRFCLASHFRPFGPLFRTLLSGRKVDWRTLSGPTECEVLSAAALLIRKEAIDKVGVLAEDYFLFSEENDFFFRMQQAGFKSYYLPKTEITHLIGMSRKKRGSIDSEVNFFRSRLLFFAKFHPDKLTRFKCVYRFFFGWSRMFELLASLIKGRNEQATPPLYKQLLRTLHEER